MCVGGLSLITSNQSKHLENFNNGKVNTRYWLYNTGYYYTIALQKG